MGGKKSLVPLSMDGCFESDAIFTPYSLNARDVSRSLKLRYNSVIYL